jgi:hypothetical protein
VAAKQGEWHRHFDVASVRMFPSFANDAAEFADHRGRQETQIEIKNNATDTDGSHATCFRAFSLP